MGRAIRYQDELRNRPVVGSGGRVVGDVDDIVLDPDSGRIVMIRVKLRPGVAGSIGVRETLFGRARVDVPWELVQGISETVVLRTTGAELGRQAQASHGGPPNAI